MNEAIKQATDHLATADTVMASLIAQWGPCSIIPHTDYYHALVSSIIGQQLSVKAADTIERRFIDLFGGQLPNPADLIEIDPEALRGVGLSYAKARYVRDLAEHILDGRLDIEKLPKLSNDEIITELTAIKGIGEWTAHMFLIFCLGRQDILPVGDLGIRMGVKGLYDFDHVPTPAEVRIVADTHGWSPYESIASWYLWRSLENKA